MSVFNRYIYGGFLYNVFLGFIIFNFLIVLVSQVYDVIKWLISGKISLIGVFEYVLCIMPLYLNYTLPLAVVFGTVGFIGKLSSNFEVIALNSFGISNLFLFFRLLILVLIISILHLVFNEFLSYKFIKRALDIYYSLKDDRAGAVGGSIENFSLRRNFIDFYQYIYASKYFIDSNFMEEVIVIKVSKRGLGIVEYIEAKNAKLVSQDLWMLYDVDIKKYSDGNLDKELHLDKVAYNLFDFSLIDKKKRKRHREEMNIFEIYSQLSKLRTIDKDIYKELSKDLLIKLNLKFIFPLSSFFLFFLVFKFSLVPIRGSNFVGISVS